VVASATRDGRKLVAVVLGEPSVASRNQRATDLLEKGFRRHFWKSLFGTSLDRLAIQASLSDSPIHLRDRVCGVARAKSTARRSVTSKSHGLDARGSGAPANAISAGEAN
jgi:D-alanyl-D-alanine carboxypeptidase